MEEQLKIDFDKVVKGLKLSDENIKFRKKSLDKFIKNGFPNKRKEEWKFSDLSQIINSNIKELTFFNDHLESFEVEDSIYIQNFEHNKIVFINNSISKIDFSYEEKDKIEIIKDLDLIKDNNQINTLISLNNALLANYVKITIKQNYSLNKPLVIYNITNKKIDSTVINLRTDITLEENSSLKLINFANDKSTNNFFNIYQNFKIHKNAILKNYKIDFNDNLNIKYFFNNIDLDNNSLAETFVFSKGSKFIKNEINCNLNHVHSSAFINGIINLDKSKQHEIKTNINHLAENTKSYQLIKCVLNDTAKGVYQGKIFVDSKAQKTDGYQLSKALLLSDNTEFDAKPELEIYADDVKCSHGSTSGNLDENSIFYLMSRGLNYKQSRELLINGFLLDVVEKITDIEIKNFIKHIMGVNE
ncbi:Fe-S cluster assembly protein SufD [Candidatus Pelagibacter sp.]|nr:Fe-S cluster assembly protein SufD [Candidatus Pelagibacter sp.]